jgi:hypothetical protein
MKPGGNPFSKGNPKTKPPPPRKPPPGSKAHEILSRKVGGPAPRAEPSGQARAQFDAKKEEMVKRRREQMQKAGQEAQAAAGATGTTNPTGSGKRGPAGAKGRGWGPAQPPAPKKKGGTQWGKNLFGGIGANSKTSLKEAMGKMGKKAYQNGGAGSGAPPQKKKGGGFFKNIKSKLSKQASAFNNARGQRESGL